MVATADTEGEGRGRKNNTNITSQRRKCSVSIEEPLQTIMITVSTAMITHTLVLELKPNLFRSSRSCSRQLRRGSVARKRGKSDAGGLRTADISPVVVLLLWNVHVLLAPSVRSVLTRGRR